MIPRELGARAEGIARNILEEKGFQILDTNFTCTGGELDIVARDSNSLVFVEVKCRTRAEGLVQAVGPKKIRNLRRAAETYLHRKGMDESDYRFMIIYVTPQQGTDGPVDLWICEDPF